LGGGQFDCPVLIIEGHKEGLVPEALKMLRNMRENVLRIGQDQMRWLPYPIEEGCGLCVNLFSASLACATPKLVLIMGRELEGKIKMKPYKANSIVKIGERVLIQTSRGEIPGLWTYHPTQMLQEPNLKVKCFSHLQDFSTMIRRNL
jgi:uracil-DNA glycosylase family 4